MSVSAPLLSFKKPEIAQHHSLGINPQAMADFVSFNVIGGMDGNIAANRDHFDFRFSIFDFRLKGLVICGVGGNDAVG